MVGDEISASGALQGRLSSKDFIIIPIFQFSCYYTVGGSMHWHAIHTYICLQHFEEEERQIKFFYAFSLCRPHLSLFLIFFTTFTAVFSFFFFIFGDSSNATYSFIASWTHAFVNVCDIQDLLHGTYTNIQPNTMEMSLKVLLLLLLLICSICCTDMSDWDNVLWREYIVYSVKKLIGRENRNENFSHFSRMRWCCHHR